MADASGRIADALMPARDGGRAVDSDEVPMRFGYFGWAPLAYYSRPATHEQVRDVLAAVKAETRSLRPFERFVCARDLMVRRMRVR